MKNKTGNAVCDIKTRLDKKLKTDVLTTQLMEFGEMPQKKTYGILLFSKSVFL